MSDADGIKIMNERLMTLLDLIESETDDEEVQRMAQMRFEIAEDCGFTVEFGGEASTLVQ